MALLEAQVMEMVMELDEKWGWEELLQNNEAHP